MAREKHATGPDPGTPGHYFRGAQAQPFAGRSPEPAASAPSPSPFPSVPSSPPPVVSIDDQVRELARRRDAGLISYEQFAALKAEIFARS